MESIGKAVLRMASELPGRNKSEHKVASKGTKPRKLSPFLSGEGNMDSRMLIAAIHSGGVVVMAWLQGRIEQLERPSSSQKEIFGEK